jgi:hypothetical protein
MSDVNLSGAVGEICAVVEIKRAATGLTETVTLKSPVTQEQIDALKPEEK